MHREKNVFLIKCLLNGCRSDKEMAFKNQLRCALERAFRFSNPAKSLYSYWKERIQPNQWQIQIDRLSDEKISWDQFFESSAISNHPALSFSTTKGGHSLLHLAVYQNKEEWVYRLASLLPSVLNTYGLTALDVAKFLGRTKYMELLGAPAPKSFANVKIYNPEKLQNFTYLEEPIFETAQALDLVLEKTAIAKSRDQIPAEKIWMGIYFNKEVQKGHHPKVALKWIDDTLGFGVFAQQRIQSCTFIGEYTGVIKDLGKRSTKDNYYCVQYTSWGIRRKKLSIDAQNSGNFTRFINHSQTPNLGLQSIYWCGLPRMVLVSLKEIEKGEQLTFDYGSLFWKHCPQAPLPIK